MDAREAPASAKDWLPLLNRYRGANGARSVQEIAVTIVPFVLLWIATWICLEVSVLLSLAIAVPAAGFLVRLFMIQHDCGHGALFARRSANDWIGRSISVLTLTPYDAWRRSHSVHHATSGNLDQRGIGDITTLTVSEYLARPRLARLGYRLYRNPLVMFGLGPAYIFLLRNRVPMDGTMLRWRSWLSPMTTNLSIALLAAGMIWLIGLKPFLLVHVPIVLIAASIGVWLFYVQHQFEDTSWAKADSWTVHGAALHGSSYFELPPALDWLTASIGVHHVHHMCSRIPFYRLPNVLRDHPELKNVGRLSLLQSLSCARLALWDETRRRLISFRQLADMRRAGELPA
ncbi:MAG: fatty acid desaturase [Hyphomicrobiaceae bacterium]|nr:fatty acid desaturase [Hyphomicrobiaceae bacterium]